MTKVTTDVVGCWIEVLHADGSVSIHNADTAEMEDALLLYRDGQVVYGIAAGEWVKIRKHRSWQ